MSESYGKIRRIGRGHRVSGIHDCFVTVFSAFLIGGPEIDVVADQRDAHCLHPQFLAQLFRKVVSQCDVLQTDVGHAVQEAVGVRCRFHVVLIDDAGADSQFSRFFPMVQCFERCVGFDDVVSRIQGETIQGGVLPAADCIVQHKP